MSTICGLDFGTSNSALAISHDGRVTMVDVDLKNSNPKYLKSVLYFYRDEERENIHTGEEAIEEYLLNGSDGRYMQSIKSFLPDATFTETTINRKSFSIDRLVSLILRDLKIKGEQAGNCELESVVLGRPVVFSEDPKKDGMAQARLRSAALLAGFKNIEFQLEPIAAALSYEKSLEPGEEELIFVGDFGGGTSDFTIIRLKGGNNNDYDRNDDILSLGGIYIGGNTFDSDLMWEKAAPYLGKDARVTLPMGSNSLGLSSTITRKLRLWNWIPHLKEPKFVRSLDEFYKFASFSDRRFIKNLQTLVEYNLGLNLYRSVEQTKCELSNLECATLDFNEQGIVIKERVRKEEFESMIKVNVERIKGSIGETMNRAGLCEKNIDKVFLTGGSSHIPMLQKVFMEKFGPEKIKHADAFLSVAYGLGLSANYMFGPNR